MSWFCSTNLQDLFTVLNICSKCKKLPEQEVYKPPESSKSMNFIVARKTTKLWTSSSTLPNYPKPTLSSEPFII